MCPFITRQLHSAKPIQQLGLGSVESKLRGRGVTLLYTQSISMSNSDGSRCIVSVQNDVCDVLIAADQIKAIATATGSTLRETAIATTLHELGFDKALAALDDLQRRGVKMEI